jgi:hypothetical protein
VPNSFVILRKRTGTFETAGIALFSTVDDPKLSKWNESPHILYKVFVVAVVFPPRQHREQVFSSHFQSDEENFIFLNCDRSVAVDNNKRRSQLAFVNDSPLPRSTESKCSLPERTKNKFSLRAAPRDVFSPASSRFQSDKENLIFLYCYRSGNVDNNNRRFQPRLLLSLLGRWSQ